MKKLIFVLLAALPAGLQAQEITDSLGFASAVSSPVEIIAGKISGVNVNNQTGSPLAESRVDIRGVNTIRQDTQPLFVVDGVKLNPDVKMNRDAFWQYADSPEFKALDPLAFIATEDIKSIEVIKDIAATSIYGSDGANGVVLIRTKSATSRGNNFRWASNIGGSKAGVSHNHNLQLYGNNGKSRYGFSANFRHKTGAEKGTASNYGGLRFNLETSAGEHFDFGLNSILSVGGTDTGVVFDDDAVEYHAILDAMVRVNFGKFVHWQNNFCADVQDNTRSIWYGMDTAFGAAHNNAISKLSSIAAGWNITSKFFFDRYFAGTHHLYAEAGGEFLGKLDIFNTLNGCNVQSTEHRARGINYANSHFDPRVFEYNRSRLAAFARVEYNYDKIAGIEGTVRAEWSLKYSTKPIIYPSGQIYVDIARLAFRDFKPVSRLKLVGNYGISGKEQFLPYRKFEDYLFSEVPAIPEGTDGFYEGLMRMKTTEWTAGLEAGFLSNRIMVAAKYYHRITADNFEMYRYGEPALKDGVPSPIWIYKNTSIDAASSSTISNKGLEFDINATAIQNKLCKLDLFANLSRNFNMITDAEAHVLNEAEYIAAAQAQTIYNLYGFQTRDGVLVDQTGEGLITEADKVLLGTTIPKWIAGLGANFSIWRFSSELLLRGAWGTKAIDMDSMQKAGTQYLTDQYVVSGDYVRFSRFALGYDIQLPTKSKVKNLKVKLGYAQDMPKLFNVFAGASIIF